MSSVAKPTSKPTSGRARSSAGSASAAKRLYTSPEARRVKDEICATGRKLWLRGFVDGNGGNISHRIGPNAVLCTPTLVSKYDLTPADICMVDLDGNQLAGDRPATSEMLLHLEIYKNVPQARAAVHCHPPYTTARAITGVEPEGLLLPEYEMLIGRVAMAPYESPGTIEFARTILPYAARHNAIILANHGVICWADSVTVAEWHCEVLESYLQVLAIAGQSGKPLKHIPESKRAELRARRLAMGFPDNGPSKSRGRKA
jgi:L-fuculose-phosphate aldolase